MALPSGAFGFDMFANDVERRPTAGRGEAGRRPQDAFPAASGDFGPDGAQAVRLVACGLVMPESVRYRIHSGIKQTLARLKGEFGTRHVRGHVSGRGHVTVFNKLFGLLVLTVDRLMRLAVPF